jgi:acyl carrier protein
VLVCAGDVADEVRMAEVRAEAVRTFGPVDGVFHLAGVPGGGLLETRSHEAVAAVQRPKVAGTYTLDEVFRPELFVLYSSIAATSGFLGEGDYAGANSVLDAFAQARWGSGRHVVSIDWAPWIDKGMARDTGGPALLRDLASGLGPARPVDHPMLRSRRERTNGDEEFAAYDIDLTPALWVLADHQMVDVPANVAAGPTIPATGVVELIRAAYADHSGAASCEIGDLIFVRPLTAEPGLAARAELRRVADGRFEVNVIGRMTGRPDTLYARGRIGPAPDGRPGVHDLAQLWTRCPDDTGDRLVSPGGIALGPRWDVITSRRSGPDLDLVTIRLPDRFGEDIDVYVAHPSMLDKACGLGMILPSEGTYLPLGYERMIVHRPLPARCVSIIRHVDDVRDDVLRADVTVVDEDGRELVVITGFTMLRMTGDGTSVVSAAAAAPAESVAVRTTAPTDVDGDGDHGATYLFGERVTGISTAGAANALRAILDSGIGPQVIVCPGGLTDWMRRADRVNLASLNGQPTLSVHSGGTRDLAIAYAAPTTEAEQQLVQLWQDAIGIDLVGIDDEFLELGGNSLVAVQLVARISEQFRSRVSVAQLFESKTVRSLAATMGKNECRATTRPDRGVRAPRREGRCGQPVADASTRAARHAGPRRRSRRGNRSRHGRHGDHADLHPAAGRDGPNRDHARRADRQSVGARARARAPGVRRVDGRRHVHPVGRADARVPHHRELHHQARGREFLRRVLPRPDRIRLPAQPGPAGLRGWVRAEDAGVGR